MSVMVKGSVTNRIIAVLMAIVLAVGLMPLPVYAATESSTAQVGGANAAQTSDATDADGQSGDIANASTQASKDAGVSKPQSASDGGVSTTGLASNEEGGAPESASTEVDISEMWSNGAITVTSGGVYFLSSDIETSGMLTVAVPAGETATIDFRGHSATVKGAVYAGIDVSSSQGTVIVTDSAYDERKASANGSTVLPEATLLVDGNKASWGVAGIMAYYPRASSEDAGALAKPVLKVNGVAVNVNVNTIDLATSGTGHDAYAVYVRMDEDDPRGSADAEISDAALSASVNEIPVDGSIAAELAADGMAALTSADAGVAYGVFAAAKGARLDGTVDVTVASSGGTCSLYSTGQAAYTLGPSFDARGVLRVASASNSDGMAFATAESGLVVDDALLSKLTNASGTQTALAYEEGRFVWRQQSGTANIASRMFVQSSDNAPITLELAELELWDMAAGEAAVTVEGGGEVAATSSDESVVTAAYADGKLTVTPTGYGEATVTVSSGGASAELAVASKATWTVGQTGYSTANAAFRALADADGGTMKLNRDLAGQDVAPGYTGGAGKAVTIDLAGHEVGSVTLQTGADVTLATSEAGGKVSGGKATTSSGNKTVTGVAHNAMPSNGASGSLAIVGVGIEVGVDGAKYTYGVNEASGGALSLSGADVRVAGSGAASAANLVALQISKGSLAVDGGAVAVEAPGESPAAAAGIRWATANVSAVAVKGGATVSAASGGTLVAGLYGMSGTVTASVEGSTVKAVSASPGSAAVVLKKGSSANAGQSTALSARGATLSASAPEGGAADAGQLAVDASDTQAAAPLSLDGACALASGGDAVVKLAGKPISLGSAFSAAEGSVTVLSTAAFDSDVFATAAEGADAPAMAKAFAPAETDGNYKGKSAVADGLSIKWGEAQSGNGKQTVNPPAAMQNLVYSGKEQTGVAPGDGYSVGGTSSATNAGDYTATVSLYDKENTTWSDGTIDDKVINWNINKSILTATYTGDELADAADTPKLEVSVGGFVNGETAETAAGYKAPTVAKPDTVEAGGSYTLTPAGGEAGNYEFTYVAGILSVADSQDMVTITLHSNYPADSGLEEATKTITGKAGAKVAYNAAAYGFTYRQYWAYSSFATQPDSTLAASAYPAKDKNDWVMPNQSIDLYVIWEQQTSWIRFEEIYTESGIPAASITYTGGIGNPIVDRDGNAVTVAPNPGKREGYTFNGWRDANAGVTYSAEEFAFPSTIPEQTTRYIAQWRAIQQPDAENADLYPLLTDDEGNALKNADVVLPAAGSYYLSQSVSGFTGTLTIGKNGEYNIDLKGNSITFGTRDDISTGQLIVGSTATNTRVSDGSPITVSIVGGGEGTRGTLEFLNTGGGVAVGAGSSFVAERVDMRKSYPKADAMTTYNGTAVFRVQAGNLSKKKTYTSVQNIELRSCVLELDLSNQTGGGSNTHASSALAAAVELTSPNLNSVLIEDTAIDVHTGTPAKTSESLPSVDAVALYACCPAGSFVVRDSALSAEADQGSAFALYQFHSDFYPSGAGVSLLGHNTLTAKAPGVGDQLAIGALNTVKTYQWDSDGVYGFAITLGGDLAVETSGTANAFDLASDARIDTAANAPFCIGNEFRSEEPLSVYTDLDFNAVVITTVTPPVIPYRLGDEANLKGSYIARFSDGYAVDAKEAASSFFANGLTGSQAFVVSASDGVLFDLDASKAEAYIVRDGEWAVFGAFEDVVASAQAGETVMLNKDVGRKVNIASTVVGRTSGAKLAIDMNGHSLGGIADAAICDVTICNSAEADANVFASSASIAADGAIVHTGTGALILDGINVVTDSSGTSVGIASGSGALTLKGGVRVQAFSSTKQTGHSIIGIRKSGGELAVKDAMVSAEAGGTAPAIGIVLGASAEAALDANSSIAAASMSDTATGVLVNGEAALTAAGKVTVDFGSSSSESCGISGLKDSTISLDGAEIEMTAGNLSYIDASSAPAYNVRSEEGSVTLSGECAFTHVAGASATHVYHAGIAFSVADDFTLAGDGATVNVFSNDLPAGDVFAVSKVEGASIEGKSGLFKASGAFGNHYNGYIVKASNGVLSWGIDGGGVASTGGEVYASVQAALNAAVDGATVTVLADCTSLPLAVSKGVVLDLAGHTVTVAVGLPVSGIASGVTVSAGRLTVTDSGEARGALILALDPDKSGNATTLRGISLASNGALTLDGCNLVGYSSGASNVDALQGVYASSGTVDDGVAAVLVKNRAQITVGSNALAAGAVTANAALTGARSVTGIVNACAMEGDAVVLDDGCFVRARSTMPAETSGSILRGNSGGGWNLGAQENLLNLAKIRAFDPGEDAGLYAAILKQFKRVATFDASEADNVYGARIYYAAPMEILEGEYAGTYVWAFSKKVENENIGKDEYIVPEKMYIQSTYQDPANAVGIASGAAATGRVSVGGNVNAQSQAGNAYGVSKPFNVDCQVDVEGSAAISATTSGTTYLALTKGRPNLNEELGLGNDSVEFYGKQSGVTEVVTADVRAAAIAETAVGGVRDGSGSTTINLNGPASLYASGRNSSEIMAYAVNLAKEFSGDDIRFTSPNGENKAGDDFATARDGQEITPAQRDAFVDYGGILLPTLAGNAKSLTWGASYAVEFLDSYNVPVESVSVSDGYEIALPSANLVPKQSTGTQEFTFAGWSTDPAADADSDALIAGVASIVYDAAKYKPDDDRRVRFYPVYRASDKPVTYTFVGARDSAGSFTGTVDIQGAAGKALDNSALARVPQPADYGIYKFVGWKTDSGTVDPSCLGNLQADVNMTLTANYAAVLPSQQLVVFKVDDYLYGYALDDGSVPTFGAAANQAGSSLTAPAKAETGVDWQFAGYKAGRYDYADAYPTSVDYGLDAALPAASWGADTVYYTAVFSNNGALRPAVKLYYYDNWGTSDSPNWKMLTASDESRINGRNQKNVTYGTNLNDLQAGMDGAQVDSGLAGVKALNWAEYDSSKRVWHAHKYLGWSVRSTDQEAMPDLPKVGEGLRSGMTSSATSYYAVYDDKEMEVATVFKVADESYTVNVPASASLQDAAEALTKAATDEWGGLVEGYRGAGTISSDGDFEGLFVPNAPAGMRFAGWSYAADDRVPTNITMSLIADADTFDAPVPGDNRYMGAVEYHAVFEDIVQPSETVVDDTSGMSASAGRGDSFALVDSRGNGLEINASKIDVTLEPESERDASLQLDAGYQAIGTFKLAVHALVGSLSVDLTEHASGLRVSFTLPSSMRDQLSSIRAFVKLADDTTACYELQTADASVQSLSAQSYADILDGPQLSASAQADESFDVVLGLPKPLDSEKDDGNIVLAQYTGESTDLLQRQKGITRQRLEDVFGSLYSRADYTAGNWEMIEQLYNDGLGTISSATTASAVDEAYAKAVADLASVPSIKGVETARASALSRLAESYASYTKSDYTSDAWSKLVEAYENAKANVAAASSVSGINAAASDGISAMAAIEPGTAANSPTATSSGTKVSVASGSNTSSGLSSSGLSNSGLSSNAKVTGVALASDGSVASASVLGAQLTVLDEDAAAEKGVKATSGLYVEKGYLQPDGSLARAGVKEGDVIFQVDGSPVSSIEGLQRVLSSKKAGDSVEFTIDRNGEQVKAKLTLTEADIKSLDETAAAIATAESAAAGEAPGDAGADAPNGNDSAGAGGIGAWFANNLAAVIVACLVLLVAASALAWWLLRRRKNSSGAEDDDDFWVDDMGDAAIGA